MPTEVGNPLFVQPGDLKDFFDIAAADFEDSEVVADAALSIGLKDHVNDKILGLCALVFSPCPPARTTTS